MGCWNFFSACDLYGANAQLGILGKQKFSTLIGIVFTLIAGIFTIGYLFLEISELVTKQQPQMIQSDHQVIETSAFPLNMDNFTFAITVADMNQDPLKTINSYFTITVQNCQRTRHLNNVTNTVEVKNECMTYPTEACSSKHFITDIQKQYFSKIRLGYVQCLQKEIQQNNPPKLQGLVSGNTYSYITIKFSICKNTTTNQNCATIEKIKQQLMNGYYALHLSDSLLQMNKVGNIQQQIIKMQFTTFSQLSSKTIIQGFRVIESNTDVGSVTTEIQQDLFLIQQSYRESTTNYNDDYLVFHYIILDDKYSQYERSYIKLLTVLSKIGGLWQLIFLIFGFISKPFILTEMKINLSNQLFRFQHKVKTEKLKEKHQSRLSNQDLLQLQSESTKVHFDKYMKSISSEFPNSFKDILLLSFGCKRDRAKQLNTAWEKMSEKLDVVEIVQKLQEFEKFKYILFTNEQRLMFDFIPKPLITFQDDVNDLQIRENKSITLDVEMDKKKQGYDKFVEASKVFYKIIQSTNNHLVNQKIIQYLDTEFIQLLHKLNNNEQEKQVDSIDIEIKQSQYQNDQIIVSGFSIEDQTKYFGDLVGQPLSFYTATGYVKFPEIGELFYHIVLREGVANFDAIAKDDVLAIWLNGGPGSSSQLGNYMEIGPWVVQKNTDEQTKKDKPYLFTKREYSWNKQMHLIFIDQPFGAGMSIETKKGEVTNSDQAANYFVQTLDSIYSHQQQLQKCKTYIFGESYGGHYVPAFATKLVQTPDTLKLTNFKGIAIVDGITDTLNQLTHFHSYLYNIGAITEVDLQDLREKQAKGQQAILNGDYVAGTNSLNSMTDDELIDRIGKLNVYNVKRYNGQSDYDYSWADFLNDNVQHFTTEKTSFSRGNSDIYKAFTEDISQSRLQDIIDLLDKKYKVLLLNGQLDYIIHTPGAFNWIYNMKWYYSTQWKNSQKQFIQLLVPGETDKYETHGYIKSYENFSYATIYKAGHMIPTDNPQAAYKVIVDFIK